MSKINKKHVHTVFRRVITHSAQNIHKTSHFTCVIDDFVLGHETKLSGMRIRALSLRRETPQTGGLIFGNG